MHRTGDEWPHPTSIWPGLALVDVPEESLDIEKCFEKMRVKVFAGIDPLFPPPHDLHRLTVPHRLLIAPPRTQGVVDVRNLHDPSCQRNILPFETIWISRSVPIFHDEK